MKFLRHSGKGLRGGSQFVILCLTFRVLEGLTVDPIGYGVLICFNLVKFISNVGEDTNAVSTSSAPARPQSLPRIGIQRCAVEPLAFQGSNLHSYARNARSVPGSFSSWQCSIPRVC
jgi:hypothetical protein